MAVSAIQKTDNNRKKARTVHAVTAGAISAYVLKHSLPLMKAEKNQYRLFCDLVNVSDKNYKKDLFVSQMKSIRPSAKFIALGAGAGLIVASIGNLFKGKSNKDTK